MQVVKFGECLEIKTLFLKLVDKELMKRLFFFFFINDIRFLDIDGKFFLIEVFYQ